MRKNISGIKANGYERRQVFDIPSIEMLVTAHRGEVKNYLHCQIINHAVFADEVIQPLQYGSNV